MTSTRIPAPFILAGMFALGGIEHPKYFAVGQIMALSMGPGGLIFEIGQSKVERTEDFLALRLTTFDSAKWNRVLRPSICGP